MSISTTQQVDFLWKKIIYGTTETTTNKGGANETIGSPLPVYAKNIWSASLPVPAPGSSTGSITYYDSSTAIRCMKDPTVTSGNTWLVTSTYNNSSTRIGDWIPPSIDATYLVNVYSGNPSSGGTQLNQISSGYEWVFDYQAGVLYFPNSIPAGLTDLYIVGYRYIGTKGFTTFNVGESEVTYSGASVTTGTYTFSNFFTNSPEAGTILAYFNGIRLNEADFSISDLDLIINISNLTFSLDAGDVISSQYGWLSQS